MPDWDIVVACDILASGNAVTSLVIAGLATALGHPKAYVRESAVLGLRQHIELLDVQRILRDALLSETSVEVKLAIESALRMA